MNSNDNNKGGQSVSGASNSQGPAGDSREWELAQMNQSDQWRIGQ
jgi:hypothetical protein